MDNVQEVALNIAAKTPYDDSWNPISIATVEISYQQEKDCGTSLPNALICALSFSINCTSKKIK